MLKINVNINNDKYSINSRTRKTLIHTDHAFFVSTASYSNSGSVTLMLQGRQKIELFQVIQP